MPKDEQSASLSRKNTFSAIAGIIGRSKHIVLASPAGADGDSVGSVCAFAISHIASGPYKEKEFTLFCAKPIPEYLMVLPWSDRFTTRTPEEVDLIIAFDYGDATRSQNWRGLTRLEMQERFLKQASLVGFDEHERSGFPKTGLAVNDPCATSSTEIVYDYLTYCGIPIVPSAATCLLAGAHTDTGGFSNPKTSARALRFAANCADLGADLQQIRQWFTPKRSLESLTVFQKALERFTLDQELGFGFTVTRFDDAYGKILAQSDIGGVIGWFMGIPEVQVMAHIILNPEGRASVSLRAQKDSVYDVGALASLLGGGGHRGAAGCKLGGKSTEEIVAHLKNELTKQRATTV